MTKNHLNNQDTNNISQFIKQIERKEKKPKTSKSPHIIHE